MSALFWISFQPADTLYVFEISFFFQYNQTYIKGREKDDWLLRKNIWRRMRYRRENKKMVEQLKSVGDRAATHQHMIKAEFHHHHTAAHHLASTTGHSDADVAAHAAAVAASKSTDFNLADQAAVEAAVAAAESFGKLDKATNGVDDDVDDDDMKVAEVPVQNPLESAAAQAALDAAAQLAAAAGVEHDDLEDLKEEGEDGEEEEEEEDEEPIGATASV